MSSVRRTAPAPGRRGNLLAALRRADQPAAAGGHLFRRLNEIDGFTSIWVVSMGHLMGLFDAPWLGIAPTGKMALLRYASFTTSMTGESPKPRCSSTSRT
jgi:hypothetical protein